MLVSPDVLLIVELKSTLPLLVAIAISFVLSSTAPLISTAPAFVVMSSAMMIVPVLVTVTAPRSELKAPPKVVFPAPEFTVTSVVTPPPVPAIVESVIAPSSV